MNKTRLPEKLKKSLKTEALEWEKRAWKETEEAVSKRMESAEYFNVLRPPRRPVSVRLNIGDISLLKRSARRRGVSYSQLISQWLHERLKIEYGSKR